MNKNTEEPPCLIIGAGIAGLYAAYNLKKQNIPFLVLEKSNKKNIGGRMGSPLFHGTHVAKGAGVGRKKKDKRLIRLLDELQVPYTEFNATHEYASTITPPCDVKGIFLKIKKRYEKNPQNITFKEFAEPFLGEETYKNFIICAGYTDYENEAVESTLYHYGFEDNYNDWIGLSIPWTVLLEKLISKIGPENIHANTNVIKIDNLDNESNFIVHTETGKKYMANNIIIATTVGSVRRLLKHKIYNEIESQPFLRIYGKFSKASIPIMKETVKTTTVLPGNLHKIIPINPDDGIYMIVYTDNKGARALKSHKENILDNREYLARQLEKVLGIQKNTLKLLSIIDFYWEEGTHYYKPLNICNGTPEERPTRDSRVTLPINELKGNPPTADCPISNLHRCKPLPKDSPYKTRKQFIKAAQHPYTGIMVIGEMVSQNQGWVEGALESWDLGS